MFDNLKVVELASVLAGPAVGMFFAELGAHVVKIENKTTQGDVTRKWKIDGENKDSSISAYYSSVNWNKKTFQYDFSNEKDRIAVHALIKEADIVIANFKKGSAVKFGMEYKTLSGLNSNLIYAHISGFGEDSDRPAFDVLLQAESGFMSMNGTAESGPIKIPIALIDMLAAHQLKEAILLAMIHRNEQKKGAYVSVSLYDAAIAALVNQASNWLMVDKIPQRMGSLHPNIAPYGDIFTTKEGKEIVLAIGTEEQFKELCKVLNAPTLIDDTLLNSNAQRVSHRGYLRNKLAPLFSERDGAELLHDLHSKGVPVGVVKNMKEVFENKNAQQLVLTEEKEGELTKCVQSIAFKTNFI